MRVANAEPEQIFQTVVILHLSFMGAVIMYIIVGEVMDWSDAEFDGYILTNDDGGTKLLLRTLFGIVGGISFILAFTWLRSMGYLERTVQSVSKRGQRDPDAAAVAAALQARHIARVASLESIATFGLVLYVLGGQRIDLYGFCAASIAGLLLTWPRRSEWEDAFRTLSQRYPGVPSTPWRPDPWRPELATR